MCPAFLIVLLLLFIGEQVFLARQSNLFSCTRYVCPSCFSELVGQYVVPTVVPARFCHDKTTVESLLCSRTHQVPDEHTGAVVDLLSRRKGEMLNMSPVDGGDSRMTNIEYLVPTRGMIGLRNSMLTATRGTAVMDTIFDSYKPYAGLLVCSIFTGVARFNFR